MLLNADFVCLPCARISPSIPDVKQDLLGGKHVPEVQNKWSTKQVESLHWSWVDIAARAQPNMDLPKPPNKCLCVFVPALTKPFQGRNSLSCFHCNSPCDKKERKKIKSSFLKIFVASEMPCNWNSCFLKERKKKKKSIVLNSLIKVLALELMPGHEWMLTTSSQSATFEILSTVIAAAFRPQSKYTLSFVTCCMESGRIPYWSSSAKVLFSSDR